MIVQGLKKTYRTSNQNTVLALNDVSFVLPDKGMVFLLGKSGSGKSTLLNVLSGLDSFDEGSVEVNGKNLKDYSRKELDEYRNYECGIVFQEYNLLPELNVKDNIALSLEFQGKSEIQEKVKNALDQVELSGYENRKVKELSGGQKQRVAIARAIVKDPKIIFADEPTGALDEETGKGILSLLKGLSNDRLVVVVTHDEDFAREFGDRIIELSDGKVIYDSAPLEAPLSEEKSLKAKKSLMPFKSALRVGCGNFKFHPIRLIATVLVAVISFACLAVSLNISTANTTKAYAKAMIENLQFTEIHKEENFKPNGSGFNLDQFLGAPPTSSRIVEFNEADIKIVEDYLHTPALRFNTYRNQILFSFQKAVVDDLKKIEDLTQKGDPRCFGVNATGFAVVDESICETYDMPLVGRLPQNSSEIAINDCMLNMYMVCGLKENEEEIRINSAEDILGHQIPVDTPKDFYTGGSFDYFTITGVVYTGCGRGCSHWQKEGDYFQTIQDYYHEKIFVHESFLPYYEFVVCPIGEDDNAFLQFTDYVVKERLKSQMDYKNHPICLRISNPLSHGYDASTSFATIIKFGCLYLSLIFFVLSFILLMSFIASLVRGQMKQIGILTSMGASIWQILFLYFLGALIPCGVVFLISAFLQFGGIRWFNSWLMSGRYQLSFNLISYNPIFLLVLLALAILTAFLGSLLPLLKMRKMSSAEIIRKGQIK